MKMLIAALALVMIAVPASAQNDDPRLQVNPNLPVPGELELSRLVWSTMAAIDHANRSGNYSVLRDIGATGFQVQNSAARLGDVFRTIREQQIDLSNTLLLAPEFLTPPAMVSPDVMRLQGQFGLRPISIQFDLYYQWSGGIWRLYGVGIQPVRLSTVQPEGTER